MANLGSGAQASFKLDLLDTGHINGFAGFFDVQFRGSPQNPADFDVLLSTAPDPTGATHWGQQTFALHPPVECVRGQSPLSRHTLPWLHPSLYWQSSYANRMTASTPVLCTVREL